MTGPEAAPRGLGMLLHLSSSSRERGPRSAERFADMLARARPPLGFRWRECVWVISTDLIEATWLGPHRGPVRTIQDGALGGGRDVRMPIPLLRRSICPWYPRARFRCSRPFPALNDWSCSLCFRGDMGRGCAYALTFGEGRTLASAPLPIWREPRAMRLRARFGPAHEVSHPRAVLGLAPWSAAHASYEAALTSPRRTSSADRRTFMRDGVRRCSIRGGAANL